MPRGWSQASSALPLRVALRVTKAPNVLLNVFDLPHGHAFGSNYHLINSRTRAANASTANGLVNTFIPGSKWPLLMAAFSA
jgi:hypothetical protein